MRLAALFLALVAGAVSPAPLDVAMSERLLVVAPHPDDETLAAGGLVQRMLARDGTVRVVLVTAGDGYVEAVQAETGALRPRPADFVAYGERRLGEARAAMRRLGGDGVRLGVLGFPDGGLDRHPDHRAAGLFTLMAIDDWTNEGAPMPRLLAYLVHWPGWPPGWDDNHPSDAERTRPLELPADLSPHDAPRHATRVALALSEREEKRKADALASYASQQEVMPGLLAAFVRRTEPFTLLTPAEVKRVGDAMEPNHR
jgi:LmbE family N-acetylglucosaminyl deacetylase